MTEKSSANNRQKSELSEADFKLDELIAQSFERTTWSPRPCGLDWAHCGSVFPRCGKEAKTKAAAATAVSSNKKSRAAFESQSSDRLAESDVAEDQVSTMVKLTKDPLELYDIAQPTAECQLMTPSERSLVTQECELRPVKDGAEHTDERVMTSHTEKCEKSEVTSVGEGHDVEFENCAKESQEANAEELQNTKASLSGSLTKLKEKHAFPVTSAAETAKVFSSLLQNCDWLLQNFDTRRTAQNGEIVGIVKLSL